MSAERRYDPACDDPRARALLERVLDGEAPGADDPAAGGGEAPALSAGLGLAGEEGTWLAAHLAHCPACRQELALSRALLTAAAEMRALRYERPIAVAPLVLRPGRRPLALAVGGALAGALAGAALVLGWWLGLVAPAGDAVAADVARPMLVRLVVPVPQAATVDVTGDFTGWDGRHGLRPIGGGLWSGELLLTPGRYRYVIVVDGQELRPDPAARQVVDDGFGGKSSVLDVGAI